MPIKLEIRFQDKVKLITLDQAHDDWFKMKTGYYLGEDVDFVFLKYFNKSPLYVMPLSPGKPCGYNYTLHDVNENLAAIGKEFYRWIFLLERNGYKII